LLLNYVLHISGNNHLVNYHHDEINNTLDLVDDGGHQKNFHVPFLAVLVPRDSDAIFFEFLLHNLVMLVSQFANKHDENEKEEHEVDLKHEPCWVTAH
jgi:hypothetical protein